MTMTSDDDTDELLLLTANGDSVAAELLLNKHRSRLRKLIDIRLDSRLSARVDPSDVIQDALLDANKQLVQFALERPLPFYPWIRQITLSRLAQIHRFHLQSQRRSVRREQEEIEIFDQSSVALAKQFTSNIETPSRITRRQEEHLQIQNSISELSVTDREVLILRYVEQLPTAEAASVMDVSPNGFAQKHLRALRRLRQIVERKSTP